MVDVGVARYVRAYLQAESRTPLLPFITYVSYRDPLDVGLCYRSDAQIWGKICKNAHANLLADLITSERESWNRTVESVSKLKLVPADVVQLA